MPGPIGILDGLSNEQHDQLLTWLELYPINEVLDRLAAPPPDGFNIRTHITSLRRFQQHAQINGKDDDLRLARRAQLTQEELQLMKNAASSALIQQAFQLTATKGSGPKNLAAAAKWLSTLQQQELRQRELALAEARLELERQKILLSAAIKEAKSRTQHEESKIKSAREAFVRENTNL
jgi:hypothetical protein